MVFVGIIERTSAISLPRLLERVYESGQTGRLELRHGETGQRATLVVDKAGIKEKRCGDLTGDAAMAEIRSSFPWHYEFIAEGAESIVARPQNPTVPTLARKLKVKIVSNDAPPAAPAAPITPTEAVAATSAAPAASGLGTASAAAAAEPDKPKVLSINLANLRSMRENERTSAPTTATPAASAPALGTGGTLRLSGPRLSRPAPAEGVVAAPLAAAAPVVAPVIPPSAPVVAAPLAPAPVRPALSRPAAPQAPSAVPAAPRVVGAPVVSPMAPAAGQGTPVSPAEGNSATRPLRRILGHPLAGAPTGPHPAARPLAPTAGTAPLAAALVTIAPPQPPHDSWVTWAREAEAETIRFYEGRGQKIGKIDQAAWEYLQADYTFLAGLARRVGQCLGYSEATVIALSEPVASTGYRVLSAGAMAGALASAGQGVEAVATFPSA
jgi:hypothetical protein